MDHNRSPRRPTSLAFQASFTKPSAEIIRRPLSPSCLRSLGNSNEPLPYITSPTNSRSNKTNLKTASIDDTNGPIIDKNPSNNGEDECDFKPSSMFPEADVLGREGPLHFKNKITDREQLDSDDNGSDGDEEFCSPGVESGSLGSSPCREIIGTIILF